MRVLIKRRTKKYAVGCDGDDLMLAGASKEDTTDQIVWKLRTSELEIAQIVKEKRRINTQVPIIL